ncbi:MAG: hypothetical protein WDW36_006295 [Sanguina aurantia]
MLSQARPVFVPVGPDACVAGQRAMGSMQQAFQRARGVLPSSRDPSLLSDAPTPDAPANWSGIGVASGPGRLSDGNDRPGSKSAASSGAATRPSSRSGVGMAQEEDLMAGYRKAAELSAAATAMLRNSPGTPTPKQQRAPDQLAQAANSSTPSPSPSLLPAHIPRPRTAAPGQPTQPSIPTPTLTAPQRPSSARLKPKAAAPIPATRSPTSLLNRGANPLDQRRVHSHPPPHILPPQPGSETPNSRPLPPSRFVPCGSGQGMAELSLGSDCMHLHQPPPRPRSAARPRNVITPQTISVSATHPRSRSSATASSRPTRPTSPPAASPAQTYKPPLDAAGHPTLLPVGGAARQTLRSTPGSAVATGKTNSRLRGGLMREGGEKGMRATVTVAALLEEAEVRAQADLQERVMRVTVQQHTGASAEQVRQLLQMTPEAMTRNHGNRLPRAAADAQSRYLVQQMHSDQDGDAVSDRCSAPAPAQASPTLPTSQQSRTATAANAESPSPSPPPLRVPTHPAGAPSPPSPTPIVPRPAQPGSLSRPTSAQSEGVRPFHLNLSRPASVHVDSASSVLQAPSRPQSACARSPVFSLAGGGMFSVVKRVRPPSAGSWAGRPACLPLGCPRAYEHVVHDPEIHRSHADAWYPQAAVESDIYPQQA